MLASGKLEKLKFMFRFKQFIALWCSKFAFSLFCDIKIWSRWDQLEQAKHEKIRAFEEKHLFGKHKS